MFVRHETHTLVCMKCHEQPSAFLRTNHNYTFLQQFSLCVGYLFSENGYILRQLFVNIFEKCICNTRRDC